MFGKKKRRKKNTDRFWQQEPTRVGSVNFDKSFLA